jgi:hypothetical protein
MKPCNSQISSQKPALELVVARYCEDLAWLRNIPPQIQVTVYDKNARETHPDSLQLPNIGREAHTYLHHIVTRYQSLAPWTIFCQGKPFDHVFDFHQTLRELAASPEPTAEFLWLGHIIDTDDAYGRRLFVPWSKNEDCHELNIDAFHRALFGCAGPDEYVFRLGAHFLAAAHLIRLRPLSFYERALQLSIEFPDAAHCFERSWDKVFGVEGVDARWMDGRQTVYLKPIRRLHDKA